MAGEKAGRERVDADALGRPFARQERRQIQHRRLRRGISDDARKRNMRRHAGNVDDAAAAAGDHRWPEFLARQQHAADQVQIEILRPIRELNLLEGSLFRDGHFRIVAAGGVNENRGRAQGLSQVTMGFLQALAPGGIGGEESRLPAFALDAGDSRLPALFTAAQHRHSRARL